MYTYEIDRKNTSDVRLGPQQILNGLDMKVSDFDMKKITDIGAGISPFSTHVAINGNTELITFVDPVYKIQSIQVLHEKNKDYLSKLLKKEEKLLKENFPRNPEHDIYLLDNGPHGYAEYHTRIQKYNKILHNIINIKENQELINNWKELICSQRIILNDSDGTNIQNIDNKSQDIVMMHFLLNNIDDDNIKDLLFQEAKRILTDNGYFLIIHPNKKTFFLPSITDRFKIREISVGGNLISFAKLQKSDIDSLLR